MRDNYRNSVLRSRWHAFLGNGLVDTLILSASLDGFLEDSNSVDGFSSLLFDFCGFSSQKFQNPITEA